MASFLARAFQLPPASGDFFTDDAGSPHEDNINRVHAAGIAQGVQPGHFRPLAVVTRDQMASFIARALRLARTSTHQFSDVSGSHSDNIHALFDAGITTGCTADGTRFCPGQPVLRGPMASFVARSIDHAGRQSSQ